MALGNNDSSCFVLTYQSRMRLKKNKNSIAVGYDPQSPNISFQAFRERGKITCFCSTLSNLTDTPVQAYHHSIAIYLVNLSGKILLFYSFPANIRHANETVSKTLSFLPCSTVKKKDPFKQRCSNNYYIVILNSLSQGSVSFLSIFTFYQIRFHSYQTTHSSYLNCILLTCVAFETSILI